MTASPGDKALACYRVPCTFPRTRMQWEPPMPISAFNYTTITTLLSTKACNWSCSSEVPSFSFWESVLDSLSMPVLCAALHSNNGSLRMTRITKSSWNEIRAGPTRQSFIINETAIAISTGFGARTWCSHPMVRAVCLYPSCILLVGNHCPCNRPSCLLPKLASHSTSIAP